MRALAFALLAAACSLSLDARADCGTCLPLIRFGSVVPEQRNVPTNFKPRVSYHRRNGTVKVPEEVRLEDAAGNVVPGTWQEQESGWWELTPSAPLAPDARYVVADRYPHCDLVNDCAPKDFGLWFGFYTGSGPKTDAPGIAGPIGPACQRRTCAAGDSSCCGPYDGWAVLFTPGLTEPLVRLTATAEAPGFGPVTFEVSREIPLAKLGPTCTGYAPTSAPPAEELKVTFTAWDLAGNSTPAPKSLRILVSAESCEVHVDPDDTAPPPKRGCGCGAVEGGLLAALALLGAARRRSLRYWQ